MGCAYNTRQFNYKGESSMALFQMHEAEAVLDLVEACNIIRADQLAGMRGLNIRIIAGTSPSKRTNHTPCVSVK